jgi:hypothetical protein
MPTVTTTSHVLHERAVAASISMHRLASSVLARASRSERGEGVISAAIAVLIMAILGGVMYYAYRAIFMTSSERVTSIVTELSNQPIGG